MKTLDYDHMENIDAPRCDYTEAWGDIAVCEHCGRRWHGPSCDMLECRNPDREGSADDDTSNP